MRRPGNNRKKVLTTRMQVNLVLVICIIVLLFIALIFRLVYLNNKDGEKYAKRVLAQQTYVSSVIPYKRGDIVDRKDTVLATSEKVYNLILDPKQTMEKKKGKDKDTRPYKKATVKALVDCFGLDEGELNKILKEKADKQYVVLEKKLSYDKVEAYNKYVEELKEKDKEKKTYIQGVWFEEEYIRRYPLKTLGSNFIGFTEKGNMGRWGIEEYYNQELNGSNGREYGYFDEDLELKRNIKPAVNGNKIVSTIDSNVQSIVEKEITKFNKDTGSANIAVMLMDPNNGEILAMAANSQYDLNNPRDLEPFFTKKEIDAMTEEEQLTALNSIWRNYCISDAYEPGSTYKPYTVAMGLEEGTLNGNETFECNGSYNVAGKNISCANGKHHGVITLEQSLMFSCNVAMMKISEKGGRSIFAKYQNNFGLTSRTGIDLPGEAIGQTFSKERLNPQELATGSFGQGATETMVQMLSGFCSLINGGNYYKPHIVKQILNPNGATVKNVEPILMKSTVSKNTSQKLVEYLYQTVVGKGGTAKYAQVPGYTIGGKTGTAEKQPRKDKKRLVSFIGFAPSPSPQVAIYVLIDEPNVIPQGDSSHATKLAARILKQVLPFLDIFPETENHNSEKAE